MNDSTTLTVSAGNKIDQFAERATSKADDALAATRRAANGALDKLQHGVDEMRPENPGAFTRAAAQVDELTQRGLERARLATADVRMNIERTGDRAVGYIREEPVKSVLIAAAAGAAVTALIGLLAGSRNALR
jgi:ElaB/YqjD/DUF883 family membrane-anchored ribosome-binding protein